MIRNAEYVVFQGANWNSTARMAHAVLPGVTHMEKEGTFTNFEGRVQHFAQALPPLGESRPDLEILCDLAQRLGHALFYPEPEDLFSEWRGRSYRDLGRVRGGPRLEWRRLTGALQANTMSTLIVLAKVFFIFNVVMGFVYLLTWLERKQSAVMQDRIGANRASILGLRALGLFHPIADALKMLTKEDFIPNRGNRLVHTLAPIIALFFALVSFAVIPFGGVYELGGHTVSLQILDLNIGLLYVLAAMSMGIYGFVLAGWSSANNYALLGGLRASSQMIAYEITLGATLIGLLMVFGTLHLQEMVLQQGELLLGWIPRWGIILQPLGFILFTTAALAETKRVPFDIPEGESEIIGYFVEYSGMKFGMFYTTDFVETVLAASLVTTLFLGGWQVPWLAAGGFEFPWGAAWPLSQAVVLLLQVGAFLFKVSVFCFIFMLIRWTLPRFRWDQLLRLGWTMVLPLSILNILVTGVVLLWLETSS